MKKVLVDTLAFAVSCRTVSTSRESLSQHASETRRLYDQIIVWAKKEADRKLFIHEYESAGYPSLIISTHETATPDVVFYTHVDVVGVKDEHLFTLEQREDKAYGRGTADMKAAVGYARILMRHLPLEGSFAFVYTADEEIGGQHGVKYLFDQGFCRPKRFAIMPDGGKGLAITNSY